MSYDVAVFGTLEFKRGKFRAWRDLVVDARTYRAIAKTFPNHANQPAVTVGALLEELPRLTGHGLFNVDAEGGTLHVRGLFSPAAFEAHARQIAALFLVSAEVGAEGDICLLGQGVFLGFGISVGGGQGMLMTLTEEQVQNASLDPDLDVISGYFHVVNTNVPPPTLPKPIGGLGRGTLPPPRPDLLEVPPRPRR